MPSLKSVVKKGLVLWKPERDGKAKPNKPSAANLDLWNVEEYVVATPIAWISAYP